jgi:gluconate 5-dehydrogenase
MPGPFSLDERTILLTGASRGLGRAMATAMAVAGGTVILNGRDEAALRAAAAEIGRGAEIEPFDVTDEAAAVAAVRAIEARHGRIDVLVNNAGIQHRQPIVDLATADWRRLVDTHLGAAFVLTREVAKGMIARRRGRIIMTASMMGPRLARPTIAPYVAAKAGLVGLTHALAVELGPHGVTCNAIAPGFFATEMNTALVANAEFTGMIAARTPLGRWGEPHEIGNVAVFLASDAASYVNGHTLFVDGGLTVAL